MGVGCLCLCRCRWGGTDLGPGHWRCPPDPHRPHLHGVGTGSGSDGSWLAFAGRDGELRIWDPVTSIARHTVTGHPTGIRAVGVVPDGSWLASAGFGGEVRIWDPITGTARHTLTGHPPEVRALVVAPDGSWLASAGDDGSCESGTPPPTRHSRHWGSRPNCPTSSWRLRRSQQQEKAGSTFWHSAMDSHPDKFHD
jgi:WD40 repeat protein